MLKIEQIRPYDIVFSIDDAKKECLKFSVKAEAENYLIISAYNPRRKKGKTKAKWIVNGNTTEINKLLEKIL